MPHHTDQTAQQPQAGERAEPPCLPKMRQNSKAYRGSFLVPNSIVVARNDAEPVIARLELPVLGQTVPRIYPIVVAPLKPITKHDLFRHDETGRGVAERDHMFAGPNPQRRRSADLRPI